MSRSSGLSITDRIAVYWHSIHLGSWVKMSRNDMPLYLPMLHTPSRFASLNGTGTRVTVAGTGGLSRMDYFLRCDMVSFSSTTSSAGGVGQLVDSAAGSVSSSLPNSTYCNLWSPQRV